jgi:hypothetical protein
MHQVGEQHATQHTHQESVLFGNLGIHRPSITLSWSFALKAIFKLGTVFH